MAPRRTDNRHTYGRRTYNQRSPVHVGYLLRLVLVLAVLLAGWLTGPPAVTWMAGLIEARVQHVLRLTE